MSSTYPVNLMAPRSRKKSTLKGALFFTAILATIGAFFIASGFTPCEGTSRAMSCTFISK